MSEYTYEPLEDEIYAVGDAPSAVREGGPRPAPAALDELAAFDLAAFFGPGGPLARALDGYELRPSQLQMAEAVRRALLDSRHALIEAPTGTGKSLAYLMPAVLSRKRVVIATANKSLQSQLYLKDIPFLSRVLGQEIDAVLVKGRSNYVCMHKWDNESFEQQRFARIDREHAQITHLRGWLAETESGDVDDLPFVLENDLRPRLVSFPDDCLHEDCRFHADGCWVNLMRDRAAAAQVLITNHHLLLNALELGAAGERILPPADVYIVDEAHGLEQTATSVYETAVTDYTVEQLLGRALVKQHAPEDEIDDLRYLNTLAFQEVSRLSRDSSFRVEPELEELKRLSHRLQKLAQQMKQAAPYGERPPDAKREQNEERRAFELTLEALNSAANKLLVVGSAGRDGEMVRYASRVYDRRHISLEVHAAPINPAQQLAAHLFYPERDDAPLDRTVICTSATLATNGHFAHFKARCGLEGECEEQVLPGVFDYPRQALLYQPALAAYDYRNADAYYLGATQEIERLLEASRGRALCLFTNWSGLQQVYNHMRAADSTVIWPLRAQGDAPRDALLAWFRATPHSVLLATRSFWEGVDIPGDDLSLVVLDKLPFPTPGDPLHGARMKAIENDGRSSFGDYMAPLMTLALKQGFGRLIRRNTDRGVVAILDERLSSKGYGRQARRDLPAAQFSRDFRDVHRFYQDALGSRAEFALNVWAWAAGDRAGDADADGNAPQADAGWRWQLVRLNDGKTGSESGVLGEDAERAGAGRAEGELHAAALGLAELRRRVERGGRRPAEFAVELRCSREAAALLRAPAAPVHMEDWRELRVVEVGE
jgi:ATP-dependent DNA helicase DinG